MKNIFFAILFFLFSFNTLLADLPKEFSWQGIIKDSNGELVNGTLPVDIKIYSAETGGILLFSEQQNVTITDGIVNLIIGNPLDINLDFEEIYWLEITIEGGTPLSRVQLTPVPYAIIAKDVEDDAITNEKIQNNAITSNKIAPDEVMSDDIAAGQINGGLSAKDHIVDGTIDGNDIAPKVIEGSAGAKDHIKDGTINGDDIQDFSVVRSIGKNLDLNDHIDLVEGKGIKIQDFPGLVNNHIIEFSTTGAPSLISAEGDTTATTRGDTLTLEGPLELPGGIEWDDDGIDLLEGDYILNQGNLILNETSFQIKDADNNSQLIVDPVQEEIKINDQNGEKFVGIFGPTRVTEYYDEDGNVQYRYDNVNGSMNINDVDGNSMINIDQSDRQISFQNESGTIDYYKFEITDGSSYQLGLATHEGGIEVPTDADGKIKIDSTGIEITNNVGQTLTKFNTDGTSLHKGKEVFEGGIEVPYENNAYKIITSDEGIEIKRSIDNQSEVTLNHFGMFFSKFGVIYVNNIRPKDGPGVTIDNNSGISIDDNSGRNISLHPSGNANIKGEIYNSSGDLNLNDNTVIGGDFSVQNSNASGNILEVDQSGNIVLIKGSNPNDKILDLNGEAEAVAFNETSDKRLKTNIEPLNNVIEKILKLNGYYYSWKSDESKERQIGLIAQEVQEVFPEVVNEGDDGYLSVSYSHLVAVLIEAIKKQQNDIHNLESKLTKIEKLEKENELLKAKYETMEDMIQRINRKVDKQETYKAANDIK